ncbi:MAG TPA: hypothetical protein VK718_09410 [Ferruginibacter sp.]|jgi:GMP synthase-like glutamine amidotransferase|nr:hypothetical protein [Ferruginibacter sp.]
MKKLHIHYFQHVPFEGLGCIEKWIEEKGHTVNHTKFYEAEVLPAMTDFDWLIIMGGPMGVYDDATFTWLQQEKEFIKQAITADKTVIGICLGSQLIAAALGADVYKNTQKEIGWFDVALTAIGKENKLLEGFDDQFKVFHWHGDTFNLPEGAEHLIQTDICKNQSFLYKKKVLGLQFHLEATKETLVQMTVHGKNELIASDSIQTEKEIITTTHYIDGNNIMLFTILDRLAS